MGRQATLTRLALGRSPFERPLRDENDNFILSQRANDDSAKGYIQKYDDKGHPQNLESEKSSRRLRRAQNDVLEIFGVVLRKEDQEPGKWKSLSDEKKRETVLSENCEGLFLRSIDRLAQMISSWWILSFRRRVVLYKSYSEVPQTWRLWSDWHRFGPRTFLLAGMPMHLAASCSHAIRVNIFQDLSTALDILRSPWTTSSQSSWKKMSHTISNIIWFGIDWPLAAFATLQTVHLIAPGALPGYRSFIPFSDLSPIQLPDVPSSYAVLDLGKFVFELALTPVVLGFVRERSQQYLAPRVYAVIRHLITKPDRPDQISIRAAEDEDMIMDATTIPGLGRSIGNKQRYYGPQTVLDTIRVAFEPAFNLWDRVCTSFVQPKTNVLSPEDREQLRMMCNNNYRQLRQQNRSIGGEHIFDDRLRNQAVQNAFAERDLVAALDMIDVQAWADDIALEPDDEASTATPDPQELFNLDQVTNNDLQSDEMRLREPLPIAEGLSLIDDSTVHAQGENGTVVETVDEPSDRYIESLAQSESPAQGEVNSAGVVVGAVPLQNLLNPLSMEGDLESPTRMDTPVPGLTRAQSLIAPLPRPVRRPTDIEQELGAITDELRSITLPQSSDLERNHIYRVTTMSNHLADSLGWHMSSIVTSVILMPLDVTYVRSLGHQFLLQSKHSVDALVFPGMTEADMFRVYPELKLAGPGRPSSLSFLRSWFSTMGLQILTSSALWSIQAAVVYIFKDRYGWGKF